MLKRLITLALVAIIFASVISVVAAARNGHENNPVQREMRDAERALEQIQAAEEMVAQADSLIGSLTYDPPPTAVVLLEQAKEHLANAKEAFDDTKYGRTYGLANAAERLARNAIRKIKEAGQPIKPETPMIENHPDEPTIPAEPALPVESVEPHQDLSLPVESVEPHQDLLIGPSIEEKSIWIEFRLGENYLLEGLRVLLWGHTTPRNFFNVFINGVEVSSNLCTGMGWKEYFFVPTVTDSIKLVFENTDTGYGWVAGWAEIAEFEVYASSKGWIKPSSATASRSTVWAFTTYTGKPEYAIDGNEWTAWTARE